MAFNETLKTGQAYRVLTGQNELTGVNSYDRLSFWTSASDVEFSNHTTLEEVSGAFYYAEGTLIAGSTSVTITGTNITEDGLMDVYVPDAFCKVTPNTISRTAGSVTLTFPVQETDMPVRIVCKQFQDINVGG